MINRSSLRIEGRRLTPVKLGLRAKEGYSYTWAFWDHFYCRRSELLGAITAPALLNPGNIDMLLALLKASKVGKQRGDSFYKEGSCGSLSCNCHAMRQLGKSAPLSPRFSLIKAS